MGPLLHDRCGTDLPFPRPDSRPTMRGPMRPLRHRSPGLGRRAVLGLATFVVVLCASGVAQAAPGRAVPGRWVSTGPEQADVTALAISPSEPSLMYAATASGTIYRSENGGDTWANVYAAGGAESITSLAVDAKDPFVAFAIIVNNEPGLVIRTDDGFASAGYVGRPETDNVATDPVRRGRVYTAGFEGLGISHDSGATWTTEYLNA